MGVKRCSKCGQEKLTEEFHKGSGKYGLHAYCKACCREIAKVRYAANREQVLEHVRQWEAANPGRRRERDRARYAANRGRYREKHRAWRSANADLVREIDRKTHLAKYGLTLEQYDAMLAEQGGVCAMCGKAPKPNRSGKVLRLSVDHDHKCCPDAGSCGRCVRGLLCTGCNSYVGIVEGANTERRRSAEAYLAKSRRLQAVS